MSPEPHGQPIPDGSAPAGQASGGAPVSAVSRTYWRMVWLQFRKNRWGCVAIGFVFALLLLATYAPLIALDVPFRLVDTTTGETTWPWFGALFDRNVFENFVDIVFNVLLFAAPLVVAGALLARRTRLGLSGWIGGCTVALLILLAVLFVAPSSSPHRDYRTEVRQSGGSLRAVFPPVPHSFRRQHLERSTEAPLVETDDPDAVPFVLGTDRLGRDVFTRMLYGTRISMTIGLFAVAIYVLIGIFFGSLAGYFGGWVDIGVSRLIEVMMCFPAFFLILTLAAFVPNRSIFHIMFIIGVTRWPGVARLVRAEFLKQRAMDYVSAARGLGVPSWKIIVRHVLPNAVAPVLVAATFGVAGAILTESGLSFLGLGDERSPSWGQMLTMGKETFKWWMIHIPGLAIFVTVSALNTVGDAFRDAIDPKMKL